jgi:hypothetical protein
MLVNKWVVLAVSLPVVLSTGITYCFSLWSEDLKSRFDLTQSQLEVGTSTPFTCACTCLLFVSNCASHTILVSTHLHSAARRRVCSAAVASHCAAAHRAARCALRPQAIGSAANLGGYSSFISGLAYDRLAAWPRLGPRATVATGLLIHGTGYGMLWAAFTGCARPPAALSAARR